MCWPRSCCCRCPGPSSLPWPPALSFGRNPRRHAQPQTPLWSPWSIINAPPPDPVIPQSTWGKNRQVRFNDPDPQPLIETPPAPCAPMVPFMPPMAYSPQQAQLSPELCSPRGTHPYLDWDITQFPSSAQRYTSPHSRAPAPLDGSATFPPTHILTISWADNPILLNWEQQWGPIFARGQGLHSVTVEHALDAIYQYFNQPLTPADHDMASQHAWGVISESYHQRLPRSPNLRAYDVHRGALRLDVLNGATKFSGLQCVGRDHFRLMLTA
ncbi:hypothetical protein DFH09DRAFT_1181238 [Mycena vulgaris]|nr:hypothetical protein DFH09DRAFT_1181238 [Mycena vulgaris]